MTTVEEVLSGARDLIERYGWERNAWPSGRAAPYSIRAALYAASKKVAAEHTEMHSDALRRVSEAIYDKRGSIGGITDWEHYKRRTKEDVIAMLDKAIEMGPEPKGTQRDSRIRLRNV